MWKKLTAILFLIAFTAQTFSRAVIVVDFYANQKYIAENLCINRDKPKMNCCGKCQLSKKLAQEDNKDKQNPNRKNSNRDEVISSKSFFASYHILYSNRHIITYPSYSAGKAIDQSADIFHPPGV